MIIISQTVIKTTLYSLKEISRTSFNFSNIFAALTRFPFSNDPWSCRKALLHCPEINKPKYSTLLILAACKSSVAKHYTREQIQTSVVQLFDGNFVLLLRPNKLAHSPIVDGLAQSSLSVLYLFYSNYTLNKFLIALFYSNYLHHRCDHHTIQEAQFLDHKIQH